MGGGGRNNEKPNRADSAIPTSPLPETCACITLLCPHGGAFAQLLLTDPTRDCP